MTHDPYPMLEQITRVIPPGDMLTMDLDDPKVWSRPPIENYQFLVVHWGGGPNPAGGPIEEPALTFAQKVQVQLGRVKQVFAVWLPFHVHSRGMSTIAYSSWVDSLFGRIGRLRGHRSNGGQWGSINSITHAVVLVMGFGQVASRRAWRSIGLIWFCSGGPRVVGHRFFNNWPQTQSQTSCPGDPNSKVISDEGYIAALGRLHRRRVPSRGVCVRAATLKLKRLGYLPRMFGLYSLPVETAVREFQAVHGLRVDGIVGSDTWKALAQA
jgi:hypothetical protein